MPSRNTIRPSKVCSSYTAQRINPARDHLGIVLRDSPPASVSHEMLEMLKPSSQDSGPPEKRYYARKRSRTKNAIDSATIRKFSFAGSMKKVAALIAVGAGAVGFSRLPSGAILSRNRGNGCRYCHSNVTADLNCVSLWTERARAELLLRFGWDQKLPEPFGDSMVRIHHIDSALARKLISSTEQPGTFPRTPSLTTNNKRTPTPPPPPWLLRHAGLRNNVPKTYKQNGSISGQDNSRIAGRCNAGGFRVGRLSNSGHDVATVGCYARASFECATASLFGLEGKGGESD
jgi:hypothetical protein